MILLKIKKKTFLLVLLLMLSVVVLLFWQVCVEQLWTTILMTLWLLLTLSSLGCHTVQLWPIQQPHWGVPERKYMHTDTLVLYKLNTRHNVADRHWYIHEEDYIPQIHILVHRRWDLKWYRYTHSCSHAVRTKDKNGIIGLMFTHWKK